MSRHVCLGKKYDFKVNHAASAHVLFTIFTLGSVTVNLIHNNMTSLLGRLANPLYQMFSNPSDRIHRHEVDLYNEAHTS